jgi:hypothetical protein
VLLAANAAMRWMVATTLAGLVVVMTGTPARSASLLRRYVFLPQAVETIGTDHVVQNHTLVVEWLADVRRSQAKIESLRLEGGDSLSVRDCHIALAGERFDGEVSLSERKDRQAGIWGFSGALLDETSDGTFEARQAGRQRSGRARVVVVYDTGTLESIRVWVPPGPEPVRGLLIWGNAGRNDSRHEVARERWLALARLHRFALVGTSGFGSFMAGADGRVLREQIAEIGARSGHPELERVPVIFTGHSNGGLKAWEFNVLHPQRVIAFTMSKAARLDMNWPDKAGCGNPAILVAGEEDESQYVHALLQLFQRGRHDAAPWAFVVEPRTGHTVGRAPQLWLPFFDWAIRARLGGEGGLHPIDQSAGWVVRHERRKAGEPQLQPASEFRLPLENASWVPTEALALAYLGFATTDVPSLQTEANRTCFVTDESIRLHIGSFDRAQWQDIQVVVNGQIAGRVTAGAPWCEVKAGLPGVYSAVLFCHAHNAARVRVGGPVSWVVEPNGTTTAPAQL